LRAGCSYRQRLESFLAKRGMPSPRLLEFGTIEAIFQCVAAGLGITLLPRSLLERLWHKQQVSVHELPKSEAQVATLFARRRDAFNVVRPNVFRAAAAGAAFPRGGAARDRLEA